MENEEIKNNVDSGEKEVDQNANNYIEAIKEMKANSVSKEQYDKVMADNKVLLDALINGADVDLPAAADKPVDIDALRKDLFSEEADFNNLKFVKKAVELRDAILDRDGVDVFCPMGRQISPTPEDVEAAQRLADGFKHCIEYADGDSQLFTQELQRITKNDNFIRRQ